jgi:hypothetical protein
MIKGNKMKIEITLSLKQLKYLSIVLFEFRDAFEIESNNHLLKKLSQKVSRGIEELEGK